MSFQTVREVRSERPQEALTIQTILQNIDNLENEVKARSRFLQEELSILGQLELLRNHDESECVAKLKLIENTDSEIRQLAIQEGALLESISSGQGTLEILIRLEAQCCLNWETGMKEKLAFEGCVNKQIQDWKDESANIRDERNKLPIFLESSEKQATLDLARKDFAEEKTKLNSLMLLKDKRDRERIDDFQSWCQFRETTVALAKLFRKREETLTQLETAQQRINLCEAELKRKKPEVGGRTIDVPRELSRQDSAELKEFRKSDMTFFSGENPIMPPTPTTNLRHRKLGLDIMKKMKMIGNSPRIVNSSDQDHCKGPKERKIEATLENSWQQRQPMQLCDEKKTSDRTRSPLLLSTENDGQLSIPVKVMKKPTLSHSDHSENKFKETYAKSTSASSGWAGDKPNAMYHKQSPRFYEPLPKIISVAKKEAVAQNRFGDHSVKTSPDKPSYSSQLPALKKTKPASGRKITSVDRAPRAPERVAAKTYEDAFIGGDLGSSVCNSPHKIDLFSKGDDSNSMDGSFNVIEDRSLYQTFSNEKFEMDAETNEYYENPDNDDTSESDPSFCLF